MAKKKEKDSITVQDLIKELCAKHDISVYRIAKDLDKLQHNISRTLEIDAIKVRDLIDILKVFGMELRIVVDNDIIVLKKKVQKSKTQKS
jgi:hypothetical protein